MLAAQKKIKLTYNFQPYSRGGKIPFKGYDPYAMQGMFVMLNDKIAIYYDTSDSEGIWEEPLEATDFYFKRSYRDQVIPDHDKNKIFPLGLNYELYPGGINKLEIARFFLNKQIGRSAKQMIKSVFRNLHFKYQPTVSGMQAEPDPNREPKVLFMTRTWDPEAFPADATQEFMGYWKKICIEVNQTRASIIGTLRDKLGDRFYGGFAKDAYSTSNYNKFLLPDARMAEKQAYINTLREYPI